MKTRIRLFLLITLLAAAPLSSRGQESEDVREDVAQTPNVTVVEGTQAITPTSVYRVRRRTAMIGGRAVTRIVYPVYIMALGADQRRFPAARRSDDLSDAELLRLLDRRFDRLRDRLYDMEEGREGTDVRFRDRAEEDSLVRDRDEQDEEQRAAPPRVEVVERALLETGLFRASDVNFEFDKSVLLDISENTLDAIGEVMQKYPDLRLEISGHTDSVGSDTYNQKLSERRAIAVRQYLLDTYNITPSRLPAIGRGESQPIATNANPTGRTLNRRVEFRVIE